MKMKFRQKGLTIYPIQGAVVGFEWDWNNYWFLIDLFIIRIVFNY